MTKRKLIRDKHPTQRLPLIESTLFRMAALALLTLWAYWYSLAGGFHFDDQAIFLDPYIVSSGFGWKIFRLMQTRPLTFLSFHWNYLAVGGAPSGFHVVNLLLHVCNSILVYLIGRRVLRDSLALVASVLFAIHPLQTQAVNYVFERATLLATFFALLSLLFFLQEKYAWSVAVFGLSLLAKEETIALPAFLLLYDVMRKRHPIRWAYYAAMSGLGALASARLWYVIRALPAIGLGFGIKGITPISYALTQSRVIWIYVRLFLLPIGLSLDHDISLSRSPFSPLITLPALLLLMLSIAVLAWLAWRQNVPALWALGFLILLAPSSSVIPVADVMFEHRTYFPMACMTIAAASLLPRLHRRLWAPALALLLEIMLAGTIMRNRVWHDERSLWADVVEKSPRKARGYFQLGQTYASEDPARAQQLYERGLEIEPGSSIGHTNLGLILLSAGNTGAAITHLRRALVLGGEKPLVWNNLGVAQLRMGEIDEGIKSFRRALESDPCRFDARWNLVHTLAYLGERDEALLAGTIPGSCHLLPEQNAKLENERRSLR